MKFLIPGEEPKKETKSGIKFLLPKSETDPYETSRIGDVKLDSQYDLGTQPETNQQIHRSEQQGLGAELVNAVGRAILKVPVSVAGNIGAIGDVGDYWNQDKEIGNYLTNAAMKAKSQLDKALPVYQDENSDLGTREWWVNNGSDLLASVGGFVGTGYGLGQIASSLGAAGAGLNAVALNQAESVESASQVYKDIYEQAQLAGLSGDEARNRASDAAALTMNINRINILTNLTSAGAFIRPTLGTRQLLNEVTKKNTLKNLLFEGGQEALEEEINQVAEQSGRRLGEGKSTNFDDVVNDVLSQEGLESGLLGFLGGAGQTSLTALANQLSGKTKEEQDRYFGQQNELRKIETLTAVNNVPSVANSMADAKKSTEQLNALQAAIEANNIPQAEAIKQTILETQAYSAFKNGVADKLINVYDSFGKLSTEEAQAKGLDVNPQSPDYYINKSREAVQKIEKMENIYNSISEGVNKESIFNNRLQQEKLNTELTKINTSVAEAKAANAQDIVNLGTDDPKITSKLNSTKKLEATQAEQAIKRNQLIDTINEGEQLEQNNGPVEPEESINPKTLDKEIKKQASNNAQKFVQENPSFNSLKDLYTALKKLPTQTSKDVREKYSKLVFNAIKNDESINDVSVIRNGREVLAKEIHPEFRIYGPEGNKYQYVDLETLEPFNEDADQQENFEEVKEPFQEETEVVSQPQEDINPIVDNSEGKTTTINTEFEYTSKDGELTIKLEGDTPIVNIYDRDVFKIDFDELSNPDRATNGTRATVELVNTRDVEFIKGVKYGKDSLILKTGDTVIGKFKTTGEYAKLSELAKDGPVDVTITGKWGSSAIRLNKQSSLNELIMNSPQNLIDGEIVIGTIKGGESIVPEKFKSYAVNTNAKDGQHFQLLRTPEGNIYPDMLYSTPIKDIKIGDKTVYQLVVDRLRDFKKELDSVSVANREKELNRMRGKLAKFKKELIAPLVDLGRSGYSLNLYISDKGDTKGEYVMVLNKGKKDEREFLTGKDFANDLKERFFNVNSELLRENAPFDFEGIAYDSYTDFLVKNNIFTTTLYPKRPFGFTNINISLPETQLEEQVQLTNDPEPAQISEKDEKLRRLEELLKEGGEDQDVLTRKIEHEGPYEVWDKQKELNWMSRNLPNTPVNVLESTLSILERFGVKAYGAFSRGIVYLAENSEVGTLYHEAYHAVYNSYLTDKQRRNINKQSKMTEEQQAEAYRDYKLSSENVKPKSNLLSNFFKEINYWVSDKLGIVTLKQLFDRIDNGKFAVKDPQNIDSTLFRRVKGFNAIEQKQRVDTLTFRIFNRLAKLQNVNGILNVDLNNITGNQINEVFTKEKETWELQNEFETNPKVKEGRQRVLDNWEDFKNLTVNNFSKFGLIVRSEFFVDIDEENTEERLKSVEGNERIYDKNFFETSLKESIGREVKLYLSTIASIDPDTAKDKSEAGNFDYNKDDLGNKLFLDFHEVFNYLSENLVGLESIDEMLDKIETLAEIKPQYYKILFDLRKNSSQQGAGVKATDFRHKFFTTMSNQYIDFLTLSKNQKLVDIQDPVTGLPTQVLITTFIPYETNKRSLSRQIISDWAKGYRPDVKIGDKLDEVKKKYFKQFNTKGNNSGLKEVADVLKSIGIDINPKALVAMKQDYFKVKRTGNFTEYLFGTNRPTVGAIVKAQDEGVNIFSGLDDNKGERKALNNLAKFEALVKEGKADPTFLNGQNSMIYAINSNNYTSKLVNRLRNNKNGIIDQLLTIPYYAESKLLKDLKKNSEEFKSYVFDTIFDNTTGGEGIAFNELDPVTANTTKINLFFNRGSKYGYFFNPTPSDRGNSNVYKLLKLSNDSVFVNGELNKDSAFYNYILSAVKAEFNRIIQAQTYNGVQIKNYHVAKGRKGNAFFFNQFYELNDFYDLKNLYAEGRQFEQSWNPDIIYDVLNNSFKKQFTIERNKLIETGVLKQGEKGLEKTDFTKDSFDKGFNIQDIDQYIANNIYANTELTRILSGDLAFYKGGPLDSKSRQIQLDDLNKRFGQSFVPGRDLSVSTPAYNFGSNKTFNLAVLSDNEIQSEYIIDYAKAIYNTLEDPEEVNFNTLFSDRKDFNPTEIYLRNKLSGYLKVNQTDAQGFITLDRYRDILQGQGQFSGKIAEVWQRLKEGRTSIEDYKTVLQPIKGFYFNQEIKDGLAVPTQVKYSTVPLIPAFVNNFPKLKELLTKMEKFNVDEVVFESGIKVGEYNKNSDNSESLDYITLDNSNWRIPQIVPYKDKTEENFGSQIRKLITANLDLEGDYRGESGQALKDRYQSLIKQSIKQAYDKLVPNFSNINKIVEMLREQVASGNRALPDYYDTALQIIKDKYGNDTTRIPLDQPLIKRRIESILNSLFDKKVIKQSMPGFAAVQVSSYGVAESSNDLKFVRMEDGEVKPAEILVSPQYFLNYLTKKGVDISTIDLNNLPDELKKAVIYRIPTQGKNSMLPVIIKGFIPTEAGSTIILPPEITTQAGSDYDIDKVYIEFFNFDENFNNVFEEGSKEYIQNSILDIHWTVLTSSKHFAELITPNGTTELKEIRDEILSKLPKDDSEKFWHNSWVQEDMRERNQAGKQLVGVYSIQSTSHSIFQDIKGNVEFPVLFEGQERISLSDKKNIDGGLISDDISERQSSAVDNAKEPLAGDLNDNLFTAPVISLILRTGYGNEIASWFVKQPIIEELSKEYFKYASSYTSVTAYRNALKSVTEKYKLEVYKNVSNLNIQYLKDNINNKSKEYNEEILNNFIAYKEIGDELSTVSNSLSIDTKGNEALISDNIRNLSNIDNAKKNRLINFDKDAYNNHSLNSYEEYGVRKALEKIQKYIQLDTSTLMLGNKFQGETDYVGIIQRFEEIKGTDLTTKEIQNITYDFYTFLHTHENSAFSRITNKYKQQLLKGEYSLANRLLKYKESVEDLPLILKELSIEVDPITKYEKIVYNNTRSLTAEEKSEISDSLMDMFEGDETENRLAKDLMIYSFITSGFTRGSDSFIDLIPPSMYEAIGLIDFYRDISQSFNSPVQGTDIFNSDVFINQYIQNNFSELKWIPKVFKIKYKTEEEGTNSKYIYDKKSNKLYVDNGESYVAINKLGVPGILKEYNMNESQLSSILGSNNIIKKQKQSVNKVSKEVVYTILDKLKKRFDIDYKIIDDESLDYAGKIDNGKVVINLAKVGLDTPFHEYAHPFVELIKEKNKELYSNLTRQIKAEGKILERVKKLYPELSTEDQIEEAIVQSIGEYAAGKINPNTGKSLISAIRILIDRIGKYVRQLFDGEFTIYAENIHPLTTLEELGSYFAVGNSKFEGVKSIKQIEQEFGLRNNTGGYRGFSNPGMIKKQIESKHPTTKVTVRKDGDKSIIIVEGDIKYQKVNKLDTVLNNVKEIINRQIAIYSAHQGNEKSIKKLESLQKTLGEVETTQAINLFIEQAYNYTIAAGKRINKIDELKGSAAIKELVEINDYISSYSVLDEISTTMAEKSLGKKLESIEFSDTYKKLKHAIDQRDLIRVTYFEKGIPLLADWLLSFSGDTNEAAIAEGRNDLVITRDQMISELKEASKDISKFSALFDPLITTDDAALALFAKGVKQALEKARLKDVNSEEEFGEAYNKYLKESGLNPNDVAKFNEKLYEEVDTPNGKRLSFVQKYDKARFNKDKIEFFKSIESLKKTDEEKWKKKANKWFEDNSLSDPKYLNPKYQELEKDKAAFGYYKFLTRKYLDSQKLLPKGHRIGLYLPSVRKSFTDKVREQGIKSGLLDLWKDNTSFQATDTQYGIQTQAGEKTKYLPVYFTNRIEPKDQSVDLLSSIMLFDSMSNRFDSLSSIYGEVNLMKGVINSRTTRETNSKGENVVDALSKKIGLERYIKKSDKSNAADRLNDFLDMVYYGEKQEKESILGYDIGKITNTFNGVTSTIALAGNVLQGFSNATFGNVLTLAEAAGGQWYNKTNWKNGSKEYFKEINNYFGDFGKLSGKSKIGQIIDLYDPIQGGFASDYGVKVSGNLAKKLFSTDTLFFLQHAGEHQMQTTTLLAMMDATMVDSDNGKIKLSEAYELVDGKLKLKKGVKWTEKDRISLMNKVHGINKRLHGVYNDFDKAAVQRYAIGRFGMLFRNWIVSGFRRRFQEAKLDYELESVVEGNYRTFFKVLWDDINMRRLPFLYSYNNLTNYQKQNIRRTTVEATALLAAISLAGLLLAGLEDEDKDSWNYWFMSHAAYQAVRLQSEILFFVNPKDTFRIFEEPIASMATVRKVGGFVDQVVFTWNPEDLEYQRKSGSHEKGDNKSFAKLEELIPVIAKIENLTNPEEAVKFFNK